MSNQVSVADTMLISAVRYALPRMTYMPSWTVDEVIRVWDDLSENARTVIERDVRRALDDSENFVNLVPACPSWNRLLRHIEQARLSVREGNQHV